MRYVTRAQAELRNPKYINYGKLNQPSTGHWNGPTVTVGGRSSWDHSKCASLVRGIQSFHQNSRGWADIAYNFVACPHGYVFEGRGLNVCNGANGTNVGNKTSHAIMWLSGKGNSFTDGEKVGFRDAARFVADRTQAPFKAIGHRDHKSTECPGDERYRWIQNGMQVSGSSPSTPPSSSENLAPMLSEGDRGPFVERVQRIIHDKAGGNIVVDGIYGKGTANRVKDLQRFFKLSVDGIVGPKTWGVLSALNATPTKSPGPLAPNLKVGSTGEFVRMMQTIIKDKAGGNIVVDGTFGLHDEKRVKDLQKFFGIHPHGVVDWDTWQVLHALNES